MKKKQINPGNESKDCIQNKTITPFDSQENNEQSIENITAPLSARPGKNKTDEEDERLSKILIENLESGKNVQEIIRSVIHKKIKRGREEEHDQEDPAQKDGFRIIQSKRKELYDLLDNIESYLSGKNTKEATAFFSSLLNIQSQLCLQKTDGVIAIRARLGAFFPSLEKNPGKSKRQEITLIFSPEEVKAMQSRFVDMDEDDPLKHFFSVILDQAYDVVQYNEMTGHLLLEMSNYFLHKLQESGYSQTTKFIEFKERFTRASMSLERSIDDLRETERVINRHLNDKPVLRELPKHLRALIQIKLGLLSAKHAPKILQQIQSLLGRYARARSSVAFDFNRLPSFQHSVRLRQSIIFNLQKDVLEYTAVMFEKEFRGIQKELNAMMEEIEALSDSMDPNSPEFEEMMRQKNQVQEKLEAQRRKLNVVQSQAKLIDVQHTLCSDAIKRYNKQESMHQKINEDLDARLKVDPEKIREEVDAPAPVSRKSSRMVRAKRR
ncbi:MAG: OmpH family outer membrane protein [Candidatus Omnitrophica bacterium]|nr:OmpH family outer membrane protein [Candidatus Omnitrophota bacterium]